MSSDGAEFGSKIGSAGIYLEEARRDVEIVRAYLFAIMPNRVHFLLVHGLRRATGICKRFSMGVPTHRNTAICNQNTLHPDPGVWCFNV